MCRYVGEWIHIDRSIRGFGVGPCTLYPAPTTPPGTARTNRRNLCVTKIHTASEWTVGGSVSRSVGSQQGNSGQHSVYTTEGSLVIVNLARPLGS